MSDNEATVQAFHRDVVSPRRRRGRGLLNGANQRGDGAARRARNLRIVGDRRSTCLAVGVFQLEGGKIKVGRNGVDLGTYSPALGV
jgi:hypothetical protein